MGVYCTLAAGGRGGPPAAGSAALSLSTASGSSYIDAFFKAAALSLLPGRDAGKALQRLRSGLVRRQVREGRDAGSWPADDCWGPLGGRLYSTSLAALALDASPAAAAL